MQENKLALMGVSLRRQRHMFRGYYSPDGSNLPLAGWDAIHLPNRVFVVRVGVLEACRVIFSVFWR
jgi:hypothetical protein